MKIYLAKYDSNKLGGGWSFANNFVKALGDSHTSDYNLADIYFVTSASMVERNDVEKAKQDGKKIVLRIDNVIRNSRNRNTGMTRMKDFANWADLVIYQSVAVMKLLQPFVQAKNYKVILNAVDENIFNSNNKPTILNSYLYSRYNRDETKNWEVARDYYSKIQLNNPDATLNIVGQFSPEIIEYNFDFYNNERYKYYGVLSNKENIADLYRVSETLIYTYWQDACSNTLIEALMCGCKIDSVNNYYLLGSANEIITFYEMYGSKYFSLDRMTSEYLTAIKQL